MKKKSLIVRVLFLFLALVVCFSCETPEDEINEIQIEKKGVDKDIERPGSQGGN